VTPEQVDALAVVAATILYSMLQKESLRAKVQGAALLPSSEASNRSLVAETKAVLACS